MEFQPLIVDRAIDAPASRIWKALTDNGQLKQWYFQLEGFEPRVGFEFSFNGQGSKGEHYKHNCRITAVEPEKKLSYTWAYDGYEGSSEVTFNLFPDGEKTLVQITHTGLETFRQNGLDFAAESFAKGWNHILGISLKEFVESKS